jgi:hypothetical protein
MVGFRELAEGIDMTAMSGGAEFVAVAPVGLKREYRSQRDDDVELRLKLRELTQQRRRFGYCRLHILLRRMAS